MFSEPGQILACLEAIAADSEVEVVRVNNKLARSYDAALTAGYRCATHPHRTSLRHSVRRLRTACIAGYVKRRSITRPIHWHRASAILWHVLSSCINRNGYTTLAMA